MMEEEIDGARLFRLGAMLGAILGTVKDVASESRREKIEAVGVLRFVVSEYLE
jgi:hypothetical protein